MASKRNSPDSGAPETERAAKVAKTDDGPEDFTGSTFVVTGDFDMGREAAEALVTKLGGRVVGSVAKSTSYLLLGKTGKATVKHKQAKKRKIPIVDEEWLVAKSGEDAISIPDLFDRVLEAKKALGENEDVPPGATDEQIAAAEARLGYSLNSQMKELYKLSDGGLMWEKIDGVNVGGGDYRPLVNFYKSLRMVGVDEYVHVSASGIVFEWDVSFDGQCGNTIVADSVADVLVRWAERLEAEVARKKAGGPDDGEKICRWGQEWRDRSKDEVEIDKSEPHKKFFKSFKSAYQRNFGSWPQYIS